VIRPVLIPSAALFGALRSCLLPTMLVQRPNFVLGHHQQHLSAMLGRCGIAWTRRHQPSNMSYQCICFSKDRSHDRELGSNSVKGLQFAAENTDKSAVVELFHHSRDGTFSLTNPSLSPSWSLRTRSHR